MKTGIELIAQERQEQIEKHRYSVKQDCMDNDEYQLRKAIISIVDISKRRYKGKPKGWDSKLWSKMCDKSYTERLAIAGAWCAAEIDRVKMIIDIGGSITD